MKLGIYSSIANPPRGDDIDKCIDEVIDKTYPLRETPAVLGYIEGGHARGKVVITV